MFSLKFSLTGASVALLAMLYAPSGQAEMATALVAGASYNCAVTATGGALCWGYNADGQLGNSNLTNSSTPVAVTGLSSGVIQLAIAYSHTCALLAGGGVSCWGLNTNGQLGNGSVANSPAPVTVSGLAGAVAIATGYDQSCAVMSTGGVKCWGANAQGQLGDGTSTQRTTPVDVLGLSGVVGIALGGYYSCALINTGQIKCWGYNAYGQLGNGTTTRSLTRVDVVGVTDAKSITAGLFHTCAKTSGGVAKCWGYNAYGQIGNGSTATVLAPVLVTGLSSGVLQLTTSGYSNSTCALLIGGIAKCWGYNLYGQLGSGDTVNKLTPTAVTGLAGPVSSIAIGNSAACARVQGGVQCWGANNSGQQGAGNTVAVPFPQNAVGLFGAPPPQLPMPLSPITSNTPVYTWKAIPGASSYRLRINGVTTAYTAAAANCPDGVGLCTRTSVVLTPGAYSWQVQGFNDYGAGAWSALIPFSL